MDVAKVRDKVASGRKRTGTVENVMEVKSRTREEERANEQPARERETRKDHEGIHGR